MKTGASKNAIRSRNRPVVHVSLVAEQVRQSEKGSLGTLARVRLGTA